jgi:hypothetical protein
MTYYPTVALAEKAIVDAGYVRDNQRHVWTNNGKTAKVMRERDELAWKFYVAWS